MDKHIKEYRDKHHRCLYCKFLEVTYIPPECNCTTSELYKCKVSLRPLGSFDMLYLKGRFCKYYEVNEDSL